MQPHSQTGEVVMADGEATMRVIAEKARAELPSRIADTQLAEKDAWKRYAAAKGDNWRTALAEWTEAREATLEAYLHEAAHWPR